MDTKAVSGAYEAPTLLELGSFEEMTKQTNSGPNADIALARGEAIAGHLS